MTRDKHTAPHHTPPNVIVSHVEHGMEIIHLFSGRPVCRLDLQAGVVHADINGDGIPDHIHVTGKELTKTE